MEDMAKIHLLFHCSEKKRTYQGRFEMPWHYRHNYKWRSTREINDLCCHATKIIPDACLYSLSVCRQNNPCLIASLTLEGMLKNNVKLISRSVYMRVP